MLTKRIIRFMVRYVDQKSSTFSYGGPHSKIVQYMRMHVEGKGGGYFLRQFAGQIKSSGGLNVARGP